MRKVCSALALSLLAHLALAVALDRLLRTQKVSDVPAALELSSVELSFAEQETEAQPPAPLPRQPPVPPPRPEPENRPLDAQPTERMPPDPRQPDFPEPAEECPEMSPAPERKLPEETRMAQPAEEAPAESAPQAPRQAEIDAPPRPLRAISPEYPAGARRRGEEGVVVLELEIDARGAVASVRVAAGSGFPELDAAALRAAKRARFRPAQSEGKPVASSARLPVRFRLKK